MLSGGWKLPVIAEYEALNVTT